MHRFIAFMVVLALALVALLIRCGEAGLDRCEGIDCDDENQCTEDLCNPVNGVCANTALADNTACDFLGVPGLCMNGLCEDAVLCAGIVCDDDNECTDDECMPANGRCDYTNVAADTACDFGGLPGLCKDGVCEDAMFCVSVDCNDGNDCTADECVAATGGCDHPEYANGTACDFGGLPGLCASGVCMDAALCEGVDCNDDSECTDDLCDPRYGECDNPAVADDTWCDFGGLPGSCTAGLCEDAMLCEGVICNDNRCVLDAPPCNPFTGKCPPATRFAARGTVCDVLTVDDGLCDGAGDCLEHQGDLEPAGILFDANNFLQVILKNRSLQVLPRNVGNVQVFVDGALLADVDLGMLPNDSYRYKDSEQRITLDLRITGQNRRVGVRVDTANEILETNEDHNQYTRTLTPPIIPGPDLVVSDLRVDDASGTLRIEVANDGTEDSTVAAVRLGIEVNGTVVATVTESLPALSARGDRILLSPTPAIPISTGSKVRVSLTTNDPLDEIDNSNQSRTAFFPHDFALDGYGALLQNPKISDNLRWESASGVASLTSDQMTDLLDDIRDLELGRPVSAPLPVVEPGLGLREEDAWNIFVAHSAHSLWVEKNDLVDWKLVDMTDEEVASMLDGREWFGYQPANDRYGVRYAWITPRSPAASYEFLSNLEMIRSNQLDTIYALTAWARARLYHSSGENRVEQWGYAGYPPLDRVLYALEGRKHITCGCGGTTGLYVAMLRAINIPTELAVIALGDGTHCRPSFLSVHRSMPHGDDPYTAILTNSSRTVPVSDMFYTDEEMDSLYLDPVPDCSGSVCNTAGEQAMYNMIREKIQRSFDRRGDYLLQEYRLRGPEYLHDVVLHGIVVGTEVITYAYPLFDESEKDMMISAINDHLIALGGGDINEGKVVVALRFALWNLAKNSALSGDPISVEEASLDRGFLSCSDCP